MRQEDRKQEQGVHEPDLDAQAPARGTAEDGRAARPGVSRRQVLKGLAAVAVAGPGLLAAGCGSEGEADDPKPDLCKVDDMTPPTSSGAVKDSCGDPVGKGAAITHGPLTGGATDTRLVISARLSGPASVRFSLTSDAGDLLESACVVSEQGDDYAVKVVVEGLKPDTRYTIVPQVDGAADAAHTITSRTFPEAGKEIGFTFTFGSCQTHSKTTTESVSGGAIFTQMANEKELPAFFAQTGDWTYPDYAFSKGAGPGGFGGTDKDGNNYTVFPEEIAKSYHRRLDPDYQMSALFSKIPIAHVWDDHDFAQNNAWRGVTGKQSDRVDAFERYLPVYALPKSRLGVWQQFSLGNVDFWMLDMRSQRDNIEDAVVTVWDDPVKRTAIESVSFVEPEGFTMLGQEQLDWLINGLRCSKARWKVVFCPVEINPYYSKFLELGANLKVPLVVEAAGDGYAGYPTERQKILDLHAKGEVKNIIFLTGDSHHAAMRKGDATCPPIVMAAALDQNQSPLMKAVQALGAKHNVDVDEAWSEWWQGKNGSKENRNAYGRIRVETSPKHKLICEVVDFEGAVQHTMEVTETV